MVQPCFGCGRTLPINQRVLSPEAVREGVTINGTRLGLLALASSSVLTLFYRCNLSLGYTISGIVRALGKKTRHPIAQTHLPSHAPCAI